MKIDAFFPPPPQFNQKPLPCSDLPPQRQWALDHLAAFAARAESLIGSIPAPSADNPPLGYPATSRGFALHCFAASSYAPEIAGLLSAAKLSIAADDHVDTPHVMLIDVRKYWGVLGPIPGDLVLFAKGEAAVVTKALCMGCQHFEAASLDPDAVQIVKRVHWVSTLKWIIRLVDETPPPVPVVPTLPPAEVSDAEAPSAEANDGPSSEATSTTEPDDVPLPEGKARRRRVAGQP